ncbi:MAG: family 2 glycosyl transferase [Parcubacteria group bacterium Athens0714_26]|nr:MAG: family 2 glycosyl transferase [Parcubacteria group bacterium Athens1014_26]TSD02626.1 MAG: family 2 glycosyl transferase [Parcubacteria group bacterium Athens0714_26]
MKKISIIIPSYNEKNTIEEIIRQVKSVNLGGIEKEIIVVDDGSKDGTRDILKTIPDIKYIFHEKNQGKGGAIKTGFCSATGDIVMIQDADLEYDPSEYPRLIAPIVSGRADVVYGSRFVGGDPHRVLYVYHYMANRFLTALSNLLNGLTLTDMETCYKVFKKEVIDSFKDKLVSKRFGIEPELTARVGKGNWRVYEIGISYYGRTYEEGKKINWKDGLAAIWHIIKFNLFS